MEPHVAAIFWDLGGVLVDVDLDGARRAWDTETDGGVGSLDEVFFDSGLKARLDRGEIGLSDLGRRLARLGMKLERFEAIWSAVIAIRGPMIALVRRLSKHSRMGVISNIDPIHASHIRAHAGLAEVVASWTLSCEVGSVKPEAAIYRRALDSLALAPTDALLIDDRPENVGAASKLGMDAVLFEGPDQLLGVLRTRKLCD